MEFHKGSRIILPDETVRALVMNRPHPELDGLLRAKGYQVDRIDDALDGEALGRYLEENGYNVLFKRNGGVITPETLRIAGKLFYVGLCCVGDGSVKDKPDALQQGVVFQNSPDGNADSVRELFVGTLLNLAREIGKKDRGIRKGEFPKDEKGREVAGSRLGIVGCGNIGAKVAVVAQALGMKVAMVDTDPRFASGDIPTPEGVERLDSLQALFEQCDVITLHPANFDTNGRSNDGIITSELLASFASRADLVGKDPLKLLINLARAPLAPLEVLKGAFEQGHLNGAALDVFPNEPETAAGRGNWKERPFTDEELVSQNWVLTPHVGASTPEAQYRVAREASTRFGVHMDTGALGLLYGQKMLRRAENGGKFELDAFAHVDDARIFAMHSTAPTTVANITAVLGRHFGSIDAAKTEDLKDRDAVVGMSLWAFPGLDVSALDAHVMREIVDEVISQNNGVNPLKTMRVMAAPGSQVTLKMALTRR